MEKKSESWLKLSPITLYIVSGNYDHIQYLLKGKMHQRLQYTGHKYYSVQFWFHQVVTIFISPHTQKIPCSRYRTTLSWKLIFGWKDRKLSGYRLDLHDLCPLFFANCFIAHVKQKSYRLWKGKRCTNYSQYCFHEYFSFNFFQIYFVFLCKFMRSTETDKRKKFYLRPLPARSVAPGGRTG